MEKINLDGLNVKKVQNCDGDLTPIDSYSYYLILDDNSSMELYSSEYNYYNDLLKKNKLEEKIIKERQDLAALKDELAKINIKLGIDGNVLSNNINEKYQKRLEKLLPEIKDVEDDIIKVRPYVLNNEVIEEKEKSILGNIKKAYGYRRISKKYMIDAVSSGKKYTMISTISSILALPCIMPYISSNSFTLLVVAMIINSAISFIISSSEYILLCCTFWGLVV